MALVGHKEQLDVQARISAITVKQRAAGLIESAKQYLLGQKQLASHIEHVLIGGCKNARWMLPVVVCLLYTSANTKYKQTKTKIRNIQPPTIYIDFLDFF